MIRAPSRGTNRDWLPPRDSNPDMLLQRQLSAIVTNCISMTMIFYLNRLKTVSQHSALLRFTIECGTGYTHFQQHYRYRSLSSAAQQICLLCRVR
jgi:hypothetical protein